jgi:hypothetical protein
MSIAVLATLTSLFAVAWPGQPRQPTLRPTEETAAKQTSAQSPPVEPPIPGIATIADTTLVDLVGAPVRLRDTLPAVVVLIDGCRCEALLAATAAAADPAVTVVAVTPTLPAGTTVPASPRIRLLVDRDAGLRRAVSGLARSQGRAAALLLAPDGALIKTVPAVVSVEDFRTDLSRLHR